MSANIDKDVNIDVKVKNDQAKKKFKELQKEIKETGNEATQAGAKGKKGMDNLGKGANKAKTDLTAVAVSINGLAAGITGMATALTGMNEKLLSIERSAFGIKQSTLSLQRQQEDLARALKEGTLSALDAKRAAEDVAIAYEDVVLQGREMEGQTLSMKGETVALGVSMVGTAVNSAIAFKALGLTHKITSASVTVGNTAMTTSTTAFGTALKVAFPPLIAISAVFLAWETNLGGIRDIISDLTGAKMPSMTESFENAFGATDSLNGAMSKNLELHGMLPPAVLATTKAFKNYGDFMEFQTNLIKGNTEALGFNSEANASYFKELKVNIEQVPIVSKAYTNYAAALRGAKEELKNTKKAQVEQNNAVSHGTKINNEYTFSIEGIKSALASGFNIPGITGGTKGNLGSRVRAMNDSIESDLTFTRNELIEFIRLDALVKERASLFEIGINPFANGPNVAGTKKLTEFIKSMGGVGAPGFGPNSGFGPNGTGAFGSESSARLSNGLSLAEALFRGPHNTKSAISIDGLVNNFEGGVSLGGGGSRGSNFGGRNLTRSGSLSSSVGSGNGSRRGGRNRNPNGRNDKLSVRLGKAWTAFTNKLDEEFGFDAIKFAMTEEFGRPDNRSRFGNNSRLNSSEKKNTLFNELFVVPSTIREAETRRRITGFERTTEGASMSEALTLLKQGFGTTRKSAFDPTTGFFNQVQDVIQARNFFRGKGVDFDGMSKSGVAGLLNIKFFGYREMNDQLAFQGQEQYQTVGT